MRLLILQLSDMHFRISGNPIEQRFEELMAAVLSIAPKPDSCLLLLTGDIAFSGVPEEFIQAESFLRSVKTRLVDSFGSTNVRIEIIPGNHDCFLPESDTEVRKALVEGASPSLTAAKPNDVYLNALLTIQSSFYGFCESFVGRSIEGNTRVCRAETISFIGKRIHIIALNTALLSRRDEQIGTLYLPNILLTNATKQDPTADLVVCIYHHPDNWLEPDFRRDFIKLIETSSHFVFTGHEHQQDSHWSESSTGEQTVYIQADALQDEQYPARGGFNALVLNFDDQTHRYYHYRWKGQRFSALIDGELHATSLAKKSQERFQPTPKFFASLFEDDFGFTHSKRGTLHLSEIFVYPPLSISRPGEAKPTPVSSDNTLSFLLKQKSLYLNGKDRTGKTSLLKSLFVDILKTTSRIPILVMGSNLTSDNEEKVFNHIWTCVYNQYGQDAIERYKQLPHNRRILLLDDLDESRIKSEKSRPLLLALRQYFGTIIVSSGEMPDLSTYGQHLSGDSEEVFSVMAVIRELSPSARVKIIDKWLRLDPTATPDETSYVRELEREHNFISDLIRKRALPSLPYLLVGVLQIRQHNKQDLVDPSSFGFLFQTLVTDALAISKSPKKHIARKEGILRRFAYRLFANHQEVGSLTDFSQAVNDFVKDIQVRVNEDAILQDLVFAKVLTLVDGTIAFRHPYFFHYFVARQLMDDIESEKPEEARQRLNEMAAHPLSRASQLTLIFFLFFKRKDPIIDILIEQANKVFAEEPLSDISSDVKFVDQIVPTLTASVVDENVDVSEERKKRLEAADKTEDAENDSAENRDEAAHRDTLYSIDLTFEEKLLFATARMESLGQVIRSFPDSLEGKKKIEILDCVFRLGLRTLHAGLGVVAKWDAAFSVAAETIPDETTRKKVAGLLNAVIALFVRIGCSSSLLDISRAVGTSDLEEAYEAAIKQVGDSCATQLLNLTIKLDHSEGFPLVAVQAAQNRMTKTSRMASLVLSDLVQRHTQIFPLQQDTLRKIAGILRLNSMQLIANAGKATIIDGT